MSFRIRAAIRLSALSLIALTACRITDLQLWGPPSHAPADAGAVTKIRDITYCDGADADKARHKLDLYLPREKKDFPVVVLIHGGAWVMGDNRCCGLYSSVGEFLASRGIGAVLPNYRLSPGVKHPEHVKDVARAVAWTRAHIAEHGGRVDQLFLVGHSAGGHLAALLATNEEFLRAEGLRSADIKGVIGISGVYRIPDGKTDIVFGGTALQSLRLDAIAPIRDANGNAGAAAAVSELPGISLSIDIFSPVFGDNAVARLVASPLHHVRRGLPPFLLLHADRDLPLLPGMAEDFHKALVKEGCQASLQRIADRNHNSIMFKAIETGDPTARAMLEFIDRQTNAGK